MKFLVVLTLVWYCNAKAYFPYTYGIPYSWAQQYRTQDAFGHTSFGHFTIDQNRQETRFPDGRVVGQFSYIDPKGKPSVTFYDAGPQGFRVRSNNLPVAPKPVEYTAAVAEAREVMQEKLDEVAPRQKRSAPFFTFPVSETPDETKPIPLVYSSPYYRYAPYAPFTPYSAVTHPFYQPQPYVVPSLEKKDGLEETVVPLPLVYAQPTVVDHTFKTHQLEPKDEATPADTTLIEPTVKKHTVSVPGVKYVHPQAPGPVVSPYSLGSPFVYSAQVNPAFMTYGSIYPFYKPLTAPANPPEDPDTGDSNKD